MDVHQCVCCVGLLLLFSWWVLLFGVIRTPLSSFGQVYVFLRMNTDILCLPAARSVGMKVSSRYVGDIRKSTVAV